MYKLRDWVNIDYLDWSYLSLNPFAIDLLEKNITQAARYSRTDINDSKIIRDYVTRYGNRK